MSLNTTSTHQGLFEARCIKRVDETDAAATFWFEPPIELAHQVFKAGQFLSLSCSVGQQLVSRAYSLSSAPSEPNWAITVKRVKQGLMSNFLLDRLQPEMSVHLSAPMGEFTLQEHLDGPLCLLSAGSGITPLMSMLRELTQNNTSRPVHFIHFARSQSDVIFWDELHLLNEQHICLTLDFVFSDEVSSKHHHGLLSKDLLQQLQPKLLEQTIYTCGPEPFMELLEDALETIQFDRRNFFKESFGGAPIQSESSSEHRVYQVDVPAFNRKLEHDTSNSLLETLEQNGLPIIGACRSGVCGSCKCKVTHGSVETSSQQTLTPEEVETGHVLACSTKLRSDATVELT